MSALINDHASMQSLRDCYQDAVRKDGLIAFAKKIRTENNDLRGKYSLNQRELSSLFSDTVWCDCKKPGGHRKLENIVTGVMIEYANHGNKGGVDPGAAEAIFNAVQKHLNILGNEIFSYDKNNWKTEPNYLASSQRWDALRKK